MSKKRKNSREKGKVGERELVHAIKEHLGLSTRRGQQFCGADGSADVVGMEGIHVECKRDEALNLYKAMLQAEGDSKGGIPTVWHRKNRQPWMVTVKLVDLLEFVTRVKMLVEIEQESEEEDGVEL